MVVHEGFDVDEESHLSVAEQLREALCRSAVRVVDLFRAWDDDKNGRVSRAEFHTAMDQLNFNAPAAEIDVLFREWDPDGSGAIELKELKRILSRRPKPKEGGTAAMGRAAPTPAASGIAAPAAATAPVAAPPARSKSAAEARQKIPTATKMRLG